MWDRLGSLEQRFEELTAEMGRPEVATDVDRLQTLARERASLEEIVTLYREYCALDQALAGARSMAAEGGDPEMAALAREEVTALTERRDGLEARLKRALLPTDPHDDRNVIVEVRGGTGGGEAALFAADLYRMYMRYADRHGWQTATMPVWRWVMRTAVAFFWTFWPPWPLAWKISMRSSFSLIATSTSLASGSTATVAVEV